MNLIGNDSTLFGLPVLLEKAGEVDNISLRPLDPADGEDVVSQMDTLANAFGRCLSSSSLQNASLCARLVATSVHTCLVVVMHEGYTSNLGDSGPLIPESSDDN